MNVIILFVFASLVNGAAVPATIASIDRAVTLLPNSFIAHVGIERDVELGNEEYMSMWWSGQDVVNQQSYSAQEQSIELYQPMLALPKVPIVPSSSAYLSSLSSSSSSLSAYLSSLSSSSLSASLAMSQQSSLPSVQKCSEETFASTSEFHPQSQPIHIIEESELPIAPAPASAAPANAASVSAAPANAAPSNAAPSNVVVNNSVCRTGMMRCAGDSGFDTCLFGKWGTVRLCAQGTKCISQDDNYIACTY
ncbi:hypothetical protein J3B01_004516 [Coemansia erecta]|nr:hypothetical protein J3B01_004516 [Coemansia erecta]